MGKVIEICPVREQQKEGDSYPAGQWIIFVSRNVKKEGVEHSGDGELMIYARSIERAAAFIEQGKKIIARENAVQASAERRWNHGQSN